MTVNLFLIKHLQKIGKKTDEFVEVNLFLNKHL